MLSKFEGEKRGGKDICNERLFRDIDAINKSIYPDRSLSRSGTSTLSSRAKSVSATTSSSYSKSNSRKTNGDSLNKDKKSFWNWKPLKAFSHVLGRRFNCRFTLQVHAIEGFPLAFNNVNISVHWKRRDGDLVTRPVRISEGVAEFEEELTHVCSVYGSRNGPHHSVKYESKHFLLYASVLGTPELNLGKHWVDLSRLLPLTLEELEEEKCTAKWTTSYKLSGKAKGALMNVSFGYLVVGDNYKQNISNTSSKGVMKSNQVDVRTPKKYHGAHSKSLDVSQSMDDVKVLHEVLPISKSQLSSSVNTLYQILDHEKVDTFTISVDEQPEPALSDFVEAISELGKEVDMAGIEFSVVKHEMELPRNTIFSGIVKPLVKLSLENQERSDEGTTINSDDDPSIKNHRDIVENDSNSIAGVENEEENHEGEEEEEQIVLPPYDGCCQIGDKILECNFKDDICTTDESVMKELESSSGIKVMDFSVSQDMNFSVNKCIDKMKKSRSFDDVTETVASEFLDMMGIEHSPFGMSSESEPDSPRERLLRQFEKDTLSNGCDFFDFGFHEKNAFEDSNLKCPSPVHGFPEAMGKAKMLENLETESLMREWGLNEKDFGCSSPPNSNSSGGFGSPIQVHSENDLLPPVGDGLGSFVETEDGGILRSMNPSLFRNGKNGGTLIMQASNPVVVPAEMGSDVMEILQHLASIGVEKLSVQANKLMPLEDITGSRMQQMAWEAALSERQVLTQNESGVVPKQIKEKKPLLSRSQDLCSAASRDKDEYVSLEELAPLAMDKIEALSMEGLRIQSGMSNDLPPLNKTNSNLINEGAAGLQLMDIKAGEDNNGDELMDLSLTLDEWMRLDSGEIGEGDEVDERTSKILAAHHANHREMIRGGKRKGSKRRCGFLGNNFTVALMVQLRDPLRNYEPVGAPMLGLIQVERLIVPPKPKLYSTISFLDNCGVDDPKDLNSKDLNRDECQREADEDCGIFSGGGIAQFKIAEIHVAGMKSEDAFGKKKFWGSANQQQSGSRWLLANGMAKGNKKQLIMKSKIPAKTVPIAMAATKAVPAVASAVAPATSGKGWLGDSLWSISSRFSGKGAKWKESASSNPRVRNPNVIFPK